MITNNNIIRNNIIRNNSNQSNQNKLIILDIKKLEFKTDSLEKEIKTRNLNTFYNKIIRSK